MHPPKRHHKCRALERPDLSGDSSCCSLGGISQFSQVRQSYSNGTTTKRVPPPPWWWLPRCPPAPDRGPPGGGRAAVVCATAVAAGQHPRRSGQLPSTPLLSCWEVADFFLFSKFSSFFFKGWTPGGEEVVCWWADPPEGGWAKWVPTQDGVYPFGLFSAQSAENFWPNELKN